MDNILPHEIPTIPFEISWLSFNERVLQEAADRHNPLIERFRFLGIFSSNQDEFFKVRVANIQRKITNTSEPLLRREYTRLLRQIQRNVQHLSERFEQIYQQILKELAQQNIHFLLEGEPSPQLSRLLTQRFRDKILRHIVPILITEKINLRARLQHDISYLVVEIRDRHQRQYAIIDVPERVPRFIEIPSPRSRKRHYIMVLDEVIRHCLDEVFKPFFAYQELRAWSMKFSRDAKFDLPHDPYRTTVEKVSSGLRQRDLGEPVRLSFDKETPRSVVNLINDRLGMDEYDSLIAGGRYRNFKDFISCPNPGSKRLEFRRIPALQHKQFLSSRNVFAAIDKQDILLHYPYHRFSHFTEFVRQASMDPAVQAIYINVYRVAEKSRVIESLVDAASNGKRVIVNIELRARFDEESNLDLAEFLSDRGIQVMFGIPALKVHSKICLVERKVEDTSRYYANVSTGNFNEDTAKTYSDVALFTSDQELCYELHKIFDLIERSYLQYEFRHLMVSPLNGRSELLRLMDQEIEHCKAGRKSGITLKLNNLTDPELTAKLSEASTVGVKVRLIIRSMCTLVPGIPGLTENIQIISIVGRFLEHARILFFQNNDQPRIYITSSDWMERNMDERIELIFPVRDAEACAILIQVLDMQWKDNCKARIIDRELSNQYVDTGRKRRYDSQYQTWRWLQKTG